jgi:hypothetical protein
LGVGFFLSISGAEKTALLQEKIPRMNNVLRNFEKIIFCQRKVILFLESVKSTPSKTKPFKK